MWKKLVGLNLAILLVISLFPLRVLAVQEERQPADAQVTSNSIEKLPTPTGLYWDGISMKWEGIMDAVDNLLWYEFEIYYSRDETGIDLSQIHAATYCVVWSPTYSYYHELYEAVVEVNGSGFYYFRVRAVSDDATIVATGDWSEISSANYYEMPARLPSATDLHWDNGTPAFAETGTIIPGSDHYIVSIYYGESEDAEPTSLGGWQIATTDGFVQPFQGNVTTFLQKTGYYYFSVCFYSNDITIALDGLKSELSTALFFEALNKYPAPTGLYWEDAYMNWANIDDPLVESYIIEIYYGEESGLAIDQLRRVDYMSNVFSDSYTGWPGLGYGFPFDLNAGYYYFRVAAKPSASTGFTLSDWSSLSDGFYYDGQKGDQLAAPTGLCWNGQEISWDGLMGESIKYVSYEIEYCCGTKEDGSDAQFLAIGGSSYPSGYGCAVEFPFDICYSMGLSEGYYFFFRVMAISSNITIAANSDWSELSPAYDSSQIEHITIDGVTYIASSYHSGDNWSYYDGELTLNNYVGGCIETNADLTIRCSGECSVSSDGSAPAIYTSDGLSVFLNGEGSSLRVQSNNEDVPAVSATSYALDDCTIYLGADSEMLTHLSQLDSAHDLRLENYYIELAGEDAVVPEARTYNHQFVGWSVYGRSDLYWVMPGDIIDADASIKLGPHFVYDIPVIILDGNGGITRGGTSCYGTYASAGDLREYSLAIPGGETFSNSGKVLTGYNTEADGSGVAYSLEDALYIDSSQEMVYRLYAQWSEEDTLNYITIDGESYIATENHVGANWEYTYFGPDQKPQLTLNNYVGGPIICDGDLRIHPDGAGNIISGKDSCGIYVSGSLYISLGYSYGTLDELFVAGSDGYPAIQAGEDLHILGALTVAGGGVPALTGGDIVWIPTWPVSASTGTDATHAETTEYINPRDFAYAGEQYVHLERLPYTLTLIGNGGITSDGEETHQVVFTTGTPGSLHLYYQRNVFTNGDKELLGWSETADGSNSQLHPIDEEYTFPEGSLTATLYAVWEANTTFIECSAFTKQLTSVTIVHNQESVEDFIGILALYNKSGRLIRFEMESQDPTISNTLVLSIEYSEDELDQIGYVRAFAINKSTMEPLCENWSREVDFSGKRTGEVWAILPTTSQESLLWTCDAMGAIMEAKGFTYVKKDCQGNPLTQIAYVREAIAAGNVAALMIWPLSEEMLKEAVMEAQEAGIVVAYYEGEPIDYSVAGCIYNAYEVTGMFAVQAAEDWALTRTAEGGTVPKKASGKYAIAIDTYYDIADGAYRSNAIKGTIQKSEVLELVAETSAYGQEGSVTVAYNNAQKVLDSNPDCHIFICYEPEQAIGTANAIADYCAQTGNSLSDYCVISCYAEDTIFMTMYESAQSDSVASAVKGYATYGDVPLPRDEVAAQLGDASEALWAYYEQIAAGIPIVIPPVLDGVHLAQILLSSCGFDEYVFEPGLGNSYYRPVIACNIYGYEDSWTWQEENPAIEYKIPTYIG